MDLYTNARRLSERFTPGEGPCNISEHALIGDGSTCALIGVNGSIDWLCFPRFDSPSVFARVLDETRGGECRVSPANPKYESLQAYDEGTNVVQTLFFTESGVVQLTDYMPWSGDDEKFSVHEVHRLIEAQEGSVEMEVVFDPKFDYGRLETRVTPADEGALAEGPDGERLAMAIDGVQMTPRAEGGVSGEFRLEAGQRVWVILSWRQNRPEPVAAYRPFEQLRRTRRFWRRWAAKLTYDGPCRHDVLRAALTLKMLQYAPTGAMVAAPTTSLPEWIGGTRNWDYRFSWTRDSAMAIRAMNLIGYDTEALRFFHFVRECVDRRGQLDIMVSIDGGDIAAEEILEHWAGHLSSGPVRIGNAAADQLQHDIVGPLLDAAMLHENNGGMASLRLWREVRFLVDQAVETIDQPDNGIWEPREEPQHHTHSKLMTWVAVDRALKLAPLFGGDREQERWRHAHAKLRRDIETYGYDSETGSFVSTYGGHDVDAVLLLMPIYGFLPGDDPRVINTIERIQKELRSGDYLYRYKATDGIEGEEGAFVLCGFWMAEALALAGRLDEALAVFATHTNTANHVGLIAEEIDPSTGALLGNFPQAFSHLGLIQAAARLDLALRQRDEGVETAPLHAADSRRRRTR